MCIFEKNKISEKESREQLRCIRCFFKKIKYKIENNITLDNCEVAYCLQFLDKNYNIIYVNIDNVTEMYKYIVIDNIKAYLFCDCYKLITNKYQPIDLSIVNISYNNDNQIVMFIDEVEKLEREILCVI